MLVEMMGFLVEMMGFLEARCYKIGLRGCVFCAEIALPVGVWGALVVSAPGFFRRGGFRVLHLQSDSVISHRLTVMPISGPASYLPCMDEFLEHWASVNAALPAGMPLGVGQPNPAGGPPITKLRGDLDGLKTQLTAGRGVVTGAAVALSIKRGEVRDVMAVALGRFTQFSALVRSRYAGKAYERSLPPTPSVGDAPETFLKSIEKAEALWLAINTTLGSSPLLLGQGSVDDPFYTAAMFTADAGKVRTAASDVTKAEGKLKTVLELRNDIQDVIKPILRDYRQAVVARFPAEHAMLESLPRFSPLPGNNPAKPQVTQAAWDAAENRAEVSFTPSTDSEVVRHELRLVPGAEYDDDLEVIAATLAVGQTPFFATTVLFDTPGALVSARVYAITADGRESFSAAVLVQRPPE